MLWKEQKFQDEQFVVATGGTSGLLIFIILLLKLLGYDWLL